MKINKIITETVTRNQVVDTVCDVCGLSVDRDEAEKAQSPDAKIGPPVTFSEVILGHKYQGCEYGDGEAAYFEPDICAACFLRVVVPALRAAGCKTQYETCCF